MEAMNMYRIKFLVVAILILLPLMQVVAQGSGKISGLVRDKATGKPLVAANVYIDGTSFGASTDLDGFYIIPSVPAGTYTVMVKYIGYKDTEVSVEVTAGETSQQNIALDYAAVEGEAVEVTAQAEGQIGAINQQLASNTIKNVVSSDRIQAIPDVNAAESVARLPGISLVRSGGEGQKVTVRGLSPKYNVMMVNGVRMQSTDRNDRSVDLNMIAPNILSGIEVTKALTADMDADAIGGTVNLKIGKAAEGFRSKLSLQDGYASLANENPLGNYRATALVSNRFLNNQLGVQASGFLDNFNRNSDVLSAGYDTNEEEVVVDGLIPIDLARVSISDFVTDRQRIGAGLVLDYQFSNGSLLLNNFISNLSEDQTQVQNSFAMRGNQFTAFGAIRELSNTVINNALQGEMNFLNIGMDFSVSNSISKQHRPGDLRMNVGAEQNQAGFSTPNIEDPLTATPEQLLNDAEVIDALRVQRIFTLTRDVTEASQEAVLNFSMPYKITNFLSGNLKFGGKYVRTSRENDETQNYNQPDRTFIGEEFVRALKDSLWTDLGLENVDQNLGIRAFLFEDENYDVGDFLSGEGLNNNFFYKPSIWKMENFERLAAANNAYPIAFRESAQYDYDYERSLSAFYAMSELNIGKYVTLFPGVRYESFDVDYTAFFTERFGPNPQDFRNEEISVDSINAFDGSNWFPQVHLRVKPTSWLDVRLASTKSIIYPDYRAISPYRYYDTFSSPYLFLGNPYLEPAITQNYDIYTSVYENHIGLFTAGFFYKEIDNLIAPTSFRTRDAAEINDLVQISSTVDTQIDTWMNVDAKSFVRGWEFDWQTNFWYLPELFKGLVLNINYTHINSETIYPFETSKRDGTGPFAPVIFVDSSRTGRLPDQPNDILNLTIGHDIGGLSTRLSFVYQDNVLGSPDRTYPELDAYSDAYYRWDFTAYQQLPWTDGLQMYFNFNNISNAPDRRFVSVLEKLSSAEHYGRTADVGIRFEF